MGTDAVTAFEDRDDDSTWDRFEEPAAVCERSATEWRCDLPVARAFLHRLTRRSVAGASDHLFAGLEGVGRGSNAPQVCVDDTCSNHDSPDPYPDLDGQLAVVARCLTTDPRPSFAIAWGGATPLNVSIPEIVAIRSAARIGSDLLLLETTAHVDRAMAWVAVDGKIQWSSEEEPSALAVLGNWVLVRLGPRFDCSVSDCAPVVQLATISRKDGRETISELQYQVPAELMIL